MKFKLPFLMAAVAAMALVAGFASQGLLTGPSVVSADDNCGCDVTFTKWLTVFPHMSGTIGGDVSGSYQGIILNAPDFTKNPTVIEALYSFNARGTHSFTARVQVTQDNTNGTATITGNVIEGWLRGGAVTGQYKVVSSCTWAAPQKAPNDLCFQGSLHLAAPR